MKIIFFPELVKDDSKLRALLKQNNFACMNSFTKDEIGQAGLQTLALAFIFFDSRSAYQYLKENKWPDFRTYNILYVNKVPKMNPEVNKKLESIDLRIYLNSNTTKLIEDLDFFYANKESKTELELDFTALYDENQND